MLGNIDDVAEAGIFGEPDPGVGIEFHRIEFFHKLAVFGHGNAELILHMGVAVAAFALPLVCGHRVWPPVDEHANLAGVEPAESAGLVRSCRPQGGDHAERQCKQTCG